jgi:hypothetical protein
MKYFMIKYRFQDGSPEDWHREIASFISALDADPELRGKLAYRCMKVRDGNEYFHIAAVQDDSVTKTLQSREFFPKYQARTKAVSGGTIEVVPLDIIDQTKLIA